MSNNKSKTNDSDALLTTQQNIEEEKKRPSAFSLKKPLLRGGGLAQTGSAILCRPKRGRFSMTTNAPISSEDCATISTSSNDLPLEKDELNPLLYHENPRKLKKRKLTQKTKARTEHDGPNPETASSSIGASDMYSSSSLISSERRKTIGHGAHDDYQQKEAVEQEHHVGNATTIAASSPLHSTASTMPPSIAKSSLEELRQLQILRTQILNEIYAIQLDLIEIHHNAIEKRRASLLQQENMFMSLLPFPLPPPPPLLPPQNFQASTSFLLAAPRNTTITSTPSNAIINAGDHHHVVSMIEKNKQDVTCESSKLLSKDNQKSVLQVPLGKEQHRSSADGKHSFTRPLGTDQDEGRLSRFLCLVRSTCIEVFVFEQETANINTSTKPERNGGNMKPTYTHKRSKKIRKNQVGLRCRFCAHLSHRQKANRSTCFPSSLNRIYQSVTMMIRDHMAVCEYMPHDVRERYAHLKCFTKRGDNESKSYWIDSAHYLGLYDGSNGIFFGSSSGRIIDDNS